MKTIIAILFILHFIAFIAIGFSWFGTTILFYLGLYFLIKKIISLLALKSNWQYLLLKNTQVLFALLLVIEFFMVFVFKTLNHYTENEHLFYLSDYKRIQQVHVLNYFGKKTNFPFTEAYVPNTSRINKNSEYNTTHHYNELGFRGKLPKLAKDSNEYRIIILGDSFIEGYGATEDSTISVLLEKKLNEHSRKIKFTVINGGISGSNPIYEQQLYSKKLVKYHPDLIINNFFANDIFDVQIMEMKGKIPLKEYLMAPSHIIRLVLIGILKINNENEFNNCNNKLQKSNIAALKTIAQSNITFKSDLNNKGIKVLNTCIPNKNQLINHCINYKNLIKFDINILEEWQKKNSDNIEMVNKYYWHSDGHLRPLGYNSVAEILKNKILKEVESN